MKRRVARLLEEQVPPNKVLAVTFTRVAAEDLHRELQKLDVPGCEDLEGQTLHALAMRILSRQQFVDWPPDDRLLAIERRRFPVRALSTVDPVGAGFVESLAHPGGNATGFMQFDYSLSAKWLEILKQVAPAVKREGVIRDAAITSGIGQFAVIQSVAGSLGIDVFPIGTGDSREVENGLRRIARYQEGGLIATIGAAVNGYRETVINLAAQLRLPAVYGPRIWADHGGLISYGPDVLATSRLTAGYVDRILKGEKPADLPVQAPTKYELVINVRTARALGLTIPETLLARADQVIE